MKDARWELILIGVGFAMLMFGLLAEFSSGVENGLLVFGVRLGHRWQLHEESPI